VRRVTAEDAVAMDADEGDTEPSLVAPSRWRRESSVTPMRSRGIVGPQEQVVGQARVTASSSGECGVWHHRELNREQVAEVCGIMHPPLF